MEAASRTLFEVGSWVGWWLMAACLTLTTNLDMFVSSSLPGQCLDDHDDIHDCFSFKEMQHCSLLPLP